MGKRLQIAAFVVSGLAALLWGINWWANRSLFMDEANVARNLYELTYGQLLTAPLLYQQYAPPFYLIVTKSLADLLGYSERVLRMPALLSGLLSLFLLFKAGRKGIGGYWALLPLALLAVNPTVLRYVGEVKPYATDLLVSSAILWVGFHRKPLPLALTLLGGAIAVWCSLPAIFGLAGLGLANFFCILRTRPENETAFFNPQRLKWLLIGGGWLLSFGFLYMLVLQTSVADKYLLSYHQGYFLPLPGPDFSVNQFAGVLLGIVKTAFGFTAMAGIIGIGFTALGFIKSDGRTCWLLGAPLLLALIASALGKYSLMPRLLLFALPFLWFLAAIGTKWLFEKCAQVYQRIAIIIIWLLILGGTNVVRHFWSPLQFSDGRRLAEQVANAPESPYLHPFAVPVWTYYNTIHPQPVASRNDVGVGKYRDTQPEGDLILVYDVSTASLVSRAIRLDTIRATERGCKVNWVPLFRSGTVTINCPE